MAVTGEAADDLGGDPKPSPHDKQSSEQPPGEPLRVAVRVIYYSNDGEPADNGDILELDVSTSTTVQTLLQMAREGANTKKGKIMFRMKPLKDMEASLDSCRVTKGPKDLQLLLARKERPAAVAERAQQEAEQLEAAMAIAKQEAADAGRAIPKKQRQALEDAERHAMEDTESFFLCEEDLGPEVEESPEWRWELRPGDWRQYAKEDAALLERYREAHGRTGRACARLTLGDRECVVDFQQMTCKAGARPRNLRRDDPDEGWLRYSQLTEEPDLLSGPIVEWQWDHAGQWRAYSSAESFDIERYFLTYKKFQDAGRSDLFRAEVRLGGRAAGKLDFRDSTCQVGKSAPKRMQRIVKSQDWLSNLYFYNIFKDILKKQGGVDVTATAGEMFDFRYNQDFRNMKDDGRTMTRGGEDYTLPFGWKRFSVDVKDEYDDGDNTWLREDDSGWAVAYHGTSGAGLGGILMSGFRVGPRQKFADTAGKGIYCTPLIDIAQHYSAPSMLDGHSCQIVLQLRVRPSAIRRITDPNLDWMERQYWVLDPADIRAYGVLIRELAQSDYVSPIKRAYNDRAKGIK